MSTDTQKVTPAARPQKKITVRKAGPVRLTAAANTAYIPWMCLPF